MTGRRIGRRAALGAACGAAALLAGPAALATALPAGEVRLAAIDWAMLETAAAIGHMPAAACELIRFRAEAVTPAIPSGVIDLGLRGAPNLELLQLVRPTLILSSAFYVQAEPRLRRIAPVLAPSLYEPGQPPLPRLMDALDALAAAVGQPDAGAQARAAAERRLDAAADRLRPAADRPIALVDIGDARHMRVFGADSLFGSTLARLGLTNAWTAGTQFSFLAPVPIEALALMPEVRLVIVRPVPPDVQLGLARSVLWRRLPPVAAGRVHRLPATNAFGGVPAALRFAETLADALSGAPEEVVTGGAAGIVPGARQGAPGARQGMLQGTAPGASVQALPVVPQDARPGASGSRQGMSPGTAPGAPAALPAVPAPPAQAGAASVAPRLPHPARG